MRDFKLIHNTLETTSISAIEPNDSLGAHVIFVGTVRGSLGERLVTHLEFEAYEPMVYPELNKIADEMESKWPLNVICLYHRLGTVPVGENAVIALVSAAHRKEAFEACAYLIDRLKQSVPIWKKEVFSDGYSWVSSTP